MSKEIKIGGVIIEKGHKGDFEIDVKSFGELSHPDNIPVTVNFEGDPIGSARVYQEDGVIKADISITDKEEVKRLTSVIGGKILERDKDNPKLITKFEITEVSLVSNPEDKSLKPLKDYEK